MAKPKGKPYPPPPEITTTAVQTWTSGPFKLTLQRHDSDGRVDHDFTLDTGNIDLASIDPRQMLDLCSWPTASTRLDIFGPIFRNARR